MTLERLRVILAGLVGLLLVLNLFLAVKLVSLRSDIYYLNVRLYRVKRELISLSDEVRSLRAKLYARLAELERRWRKGELEGAPAEVIYVLYQRDGTLHLYPLKRWATTPPLLRER